MKYILSSVVLLTLLPPVNARAITTSSAIHYTQTDIAAKISFRTPNESHTETLKHVKVLDIPTSLFSEAMTITNYTLKWITPEDALHAMIMLNAQQFYVEDSYTTAKLTLGKTIATTDPHYHLHKAAHTKRRLDTNVNSLWDTSYTHKLAALLQEAEWAIYENNPLEVIRILQDMQHAKLDEKERTTFEQLKDKAAKEEEAQELAIKLEIQTIESKIKALQAERVKHMSSVQEWQLELEIEELTLQIAEKLQDPGYIEVQKFLVFEARNRVKMVKKGQEQLKSNYQAEHSRYSNLQIDLDPQSLKYKICEKIKQRRLLEIAEIDGDTTEANRIKTQIETLTTEIEALKAESRVI